MISALGYIGVTSKRTEDWDGFATGLLGMQAVDSGRASRLFRMDDRRQRLAVVEGSHEGLAFTGWEVESAAELERMAARLESFGVAVTVESRGVADQRHVAQLISFSDPEGNRIELFAGPEIASDPFCPGRPISGFKTGPLGMGHAVLHALNMDVLLPFYRDVMGFKVTDYGMQPFRLFFFHLNGRHHSFAMVETGRQGLHHFMVELQSLDDVGQGYDLAQLENGRVAYTLGRHSNDHMTSFYANSPSGFFIEYGWGARVIDPETWQPHETFDGPSYWGHERVFLPEDSKDRQRLREMRLDAARRGLRAADPSTGCAWLDDRIAGRCLRT